MTCSDWRTSTELCGRPAVWTCINPKYHKMQVRDPLCESCGHEGACKNVSGNVHLAIPDELLWYYEGDE